MKVLIADDDPVSLLYQEDALQEWGGMGATFSQLIQQADGAQGRNRVVVAGASLALAQCS